MTTAPLRVGYLSGSPRITTAADAAGDLVGPRAHIVGVVDALRADGHDVSCFVLGDLARGSVRAGTPGARSRGRLGRLAVDVARVGLRVQAARRARRALRAPLDVVYERYALFQELGRPWQRAGVPWVVESNALLSEEARKERTAVALHGLAARWERQTYARADLVVAVSEPLKQVLVERAGVSADAVLVLPNGVDVARFRVAARDRAATDELLVGFVGFVIARQGLEELVRAVAAARRRGARVRARIAGDGPELEHLREVVRAEGPGDAVELLGQLAWEDVPAFLASIDVGYSGQRGVAGMAMYHSPLKIYEYLAAARPVVATWHPDAATALGGGGAGWTFDPGDSGALAALLEKLAGGPREDLVAAGRRGRAHVEQEHTWTHRTRTLVRELRARGMVA